MAASCVQPAKLISLWSAFLIIFLFLVTIAQAAQVTFAMDPLAPEAEGFRIFQRVSGENYNYQQPIWTGTNTTCTIDNLVEGETYFFVARSFSSSQESADSNEIEYTAGGDVSTIPEVSIIDDGHPGTSSTGTWKISGGADPYGTQSLYSRQAGAEYIFESMITGRCEVAVWWTPYAGRCSAVPVEIYDGDLLLETLTVNQQQDSGQWNVLGSYNFTNQAKVVIVAQSDTCSTCADAVKFSITSVDSDGDGILDPDDAFPLDATEWRDTDGDGIGDNADTDDDNDGMPDEWEAQYGLKPLVDDALQDKDGDGVTNIDEYTSGTDPNGLDENETIIIDDGHPGTSSMGTWKISGGADPYGAQSLYSKEAGAEYIFESMITGRCEVAVWWTPYAGRCSAVPVEIYDGDLLLETLTVNQQQDSGQWNVLGSYNFTNQAKVVIVAQSDTCSTCADAVKFSITSVDSDGDGKIDPDDAFPLDATEWRDTDGDGIGDNADTDDDNDGMPDEWEAQYGLNPLVDDALQDKDGDGVTNIDEYTSGTDPNGLDENETIIIDDGHPGTSSLGTWKVSGGADPYGAQSLYSKEAGAEYTFESMITGRYEVAVWWTLYAGRCSAVPVEIYDGDLLLETLTVNQQQDGGQWNVLGTYDFTGHAKVVVVSEDSACSTSADAAKFTVVKNEGPVIIDDGHPGTSSLGTWKVSGGANPYGAQSLYSKEAGAEYTFEMMITGRYEVAIWWTLYAGRCSAVPVEIYDGDLLLETLTVNQQQDGGQWNVLGTYDFTGHAKVVVVSGDSACSTSADAAKFTVVKDEGPVIIDDGHPGTSSMGTWKVSGGANPYGAQSLYSKEAGAEYTFESMITGRYEVAIWWTLYAGRCSAAPVQIYDGDALMDLVTVNQQQDGGQWNVLGMYDFTGHTKVVVVSEDSACSTSADAIRYMKETSLVPQ